MPMKKAFIFISLTLPCSSCFHVWDQEDKKLFRDICFQDARKWAGSDSKANAYCDCVMEKIVQKYPSETEALDHVDSIIKDPDLIECRTQVGLSTAPQ